MPFPRPSPPLKITLRHGAKVDGSDYNMAVRSGRNNEGCKAQRRREKGAEGHRLDLQVGQEMCATNAKPAGIKREIRVSRSKQGNSLS